MIRIIISLKSKKLFKNELLTPIWGILGTELASFLDKKSRVTFSVLMTSYLTEIFLFHDYVCNPTYKLLSKIT